MSGALGEDATSAAAVGSGVVVAPVFASDTVFAFGTVSTSDDVAGCGVGAEADSTVLCTAGVDVSCVTAGEFGAAGVSPVDALSACDSGVVCARITVCGAGLTGGVSGVDSDGIAAAGSEGSSTARCTSVSAGWSGGPVAARCICADEPSSLDSEVDGADSDGVSLCAGGVVGGVLADAASLLRCTLGCAVEDGVAGGVGVRGASPA